MKTKREEGERKEEFAGYGKLGSKFAKITTGKNTEVSIKIRIRFESEIEYDRELFSLSRPLAKK